MGLVCSSKGYLLVYSLETTNVLKSDASRSFGEDFSVQAICATAILLATLRMLSGVDSSSPYTTISDTLAILAAWMWKLRTENPSLGSISTKALSSSACGDKSSSTSNAPFNLDFERSPTLTMVRPRKHLGAFKDLRRGKKYANWIRFSGCRPCNQGNTCFGSGKCCVARQSRALASVEAVIE